MMKGCQIGNIYYYNYIYISECNVFACWLYNLITIVSNIWLIQFIGYCWQYVNITNRLVVVSSVSSVYYSKNAYFH